MSNNCFYRQASRMIPGRYNSMVNKEKAPTHICESGLLKKGRPPTLPHCIAVPSAQAGLTSLFGMGRGGTPLQ